MIMDLLKKIGWETKAIVIPGAAAFLISLAGGIVSGNPFYVVILRAFIFSIVFSALSFGSLSVLKKFVPEFFDSIAAVMPGAETGDAQEDISPDSELAADDRYDASEAEQDSGSVEPYDAPPSFAPAGLDQISGSAFPSKSGRKKLEEQTLKFQPKIMAEAIRTMMSKDNE